MRHPCAAKRAAQFMFASPRSAKQSRTPSCAKAVARMSYTRGLRSFFIKRSDRNGIGIRRGKEAVLGVLLEVLLARQLERARAHALVFGADRGDRLALAGG